MKQKLRFRHRTIILLLFVVFIASIHKLIAQPYVSSSDLLLQLNKVKVMGSVLYIAAHPDDENTRLLAYLANERLMRTAYLSLTRGDGGQNLIGKEQGPMLGLIRTQELLAARRVDGAEQFFTRAYDFGYSKSPDETFRFWNKDSILSDVVWVIRNFKPDVIICRFPTTGEGGHGHHTASALLAVEAFNAAADHRRFPEQLSRVKIWQAKRILWNTFNFGGLNTTAENQLKVNVGAYNPLLGKSYGEIAADSRSNHKSQGFGSARSRGEAIEYFKQLGGDTARVDLFEGIEVGWSRFKQTAVLLPLLDQCIKTFNPQVPQKSVASLLQLLKKLRSIPATNDDLLYWQGQKIKELEQLIFSSVGLWMEASAADYRAIPGTDMKLNSQFICRNPAKVVLQKITYPYSDTTCSLFVQTNQLYSFRSSQTIKEVVPYSAPFWLQEGPKAGLFQVQDRNLIGQAENDPALCVRFDFLIEGIPFSYAAPIVFKSTDPVKGEVYRPLEVLPAATINAIEGVHMFKKQQAKKISFLVKAHRPGVKGVLQFSAPKDWDIDPKEKNIDLKEKGDEQIVSCRVQASEFTQEARLKVGLQLGNTLCAQSISRLDYDHIPAQFTLSDAAAKLVPIQMKKSGNAVGYIPGAGDDLPTCLKQIGYDVTILTDELLASKDLSQFDAIVTGVRAYNINDKLALRYKKLMRYVQNGGNLIVQYNTNNRISNVPQLIGPYPFTITRDRVTDENATVKILVPEHPAFNFPNKITKEDFNNWIQERGVYFASDSAGHYQKLISMSDPNEKACEGSLIVAPYGKGNFVYTGLAFFRQLPAGVTGAYRLFANLLSLPANNLND